jgi:nitroreductase
LASVQKSDNLFEAGSHHREGYPRFGKTARQKLTDEETSQLLSLTALSLSAFNVNNCRFVVIRDQDLRKQINKFSLNQAPIPQPSSLIILCADLAHGEKKSAGNGDHRSEGLKEAAATRKKALIWESDHLQRDEAMCSCGIAAQTLMLTAKAMGYDTWRLEGFDTEGVAKLINLPPDHVVAMLVVVGKNMKHAWPHVGQVNFHEVVILDQF